MMYIKSRFSPYLKMNEFINVIRKEPKVRIKINYMLDR